MMAILVDYFVDGQEGNVVFVQKLPEQSLMASLMAENFDFEIAHIIQIVRHIAKGIKFLH